MIDPLCQFSLDFSREVGGELAEGQMLGHQWRETSWTDRMLMELVRMRDPRIIVRKSNEKKTGADMDWWFVNPSRGTYICLTIQAKILHYGNKNSSTWTYNDIAHPGHSGTQSAILCSHARTATHAGSVTHPLYLFYNSGWATPSTPNYPKIWAGTTFADGNVIRQYLRHTRAAGQVPITARRFSAISPLTFPLGRLLCGRNGRTIPSPEIVKVNLTALRRAVLNGAKGIFVPNSRTMPKPAVGRGIPANITQFLSQTDKPDEFEFERDTVVFQSGGLPEHRSDWRD